MKYHDKKHFIYWEIHYISIFRKSSNFFSADENKTCWVFPYILYKFGQFQ